MSPEGGKLVEEGGREDKEVPRGGELGKEGEREILRSPKGEKWGKIWPGVL